MESATKAEITAAREAFERNQWDEAYERLSVADSDRGLAGEDLERLGEAARWSQHFDDVLGAFERAVSQFEREGDNRGAARVAIKLTSEYFLRGNDAVAAGSLTRAAKRLEGDEESREYGLLLLSQGTGMLDEGDLGGAQSVLAEAAELAEKLADQDLRALARADLGSALLLEGRVIEGMEMIDEAAASALAGELEPWSAGRIFCGTIFSCRSRGDWVRASEWSEASVRWCERHSLSFFPGMCRFHLAEVQRLRGRLDEAEKIALEATEELTAAAPRFSAFGHGEIGEIRRRRGDLDGAEEAFAISIEIGWDPQPGLSLLRLEQGKTDTARRLVADAIANESFFPREGRPLVLPAAVTIGIAAGDLDFARDALAQLESLAENHGTKAIGASAAVARGEIALAESRPEDAIRELRRGRDLWTEVDAPYEVGQARLPLAGAYRAVGDDDAAESELRAAQKKFERIGASSAVKRVEAALKAGAPARRRVQTFMFTDIVDSTKLLNLLGDDSWEALLSWHDRALRAQFEKHGGVEVGHEGDGFFVAFEDAASAIECACAIQRALAEHRREHGFAPSVRAGVHTGEALDRGGDWGGTGVHAAARVGAAGTAGEVIASRAAIDAAGDGFAIANERSIEAKGFSEPIAVASVDWR